MSTRINPSRYVSLALALLLLALAAPPASAQGPRVFDFATATTAVTLTTITEAVVVSSAALNTPRDEVEVFVFGCAQLTTGAGTTAVTPRIRRGTAITSTLVSEENDVTIGAAAASTEMFCMGVSEQRAATNIQYSFTLDQVGATGNGSAIYGWIVVLAR